VRSVWGVVSGVGKGEVEEADKGDGGMEEGGIGGEEVGEMEEGGKK